MKANKQKNNNSNNKSQLNQPPKTNEKAPTTTKTNPTNQPTENDLNKTVGKTLIMVQIMGFPLTFIRPGFHAQKTVNSILSRKNCLPWSQFITVPISIHRDNGSDFLLSHTGVNHLQLYLNS